MANYDWTGSFAGQAAEPTPCSPRGEKQEEEGGNERGGQIPRSQAGDVTEEYLVDEDAVCIIDEMLD
jgi:hypothetical protein